MSRKKHINDNVIVIVYSCKGSQVQWGLSSTLKKKNELSFICGLGESTNNQGEVLAPLQGLSITKSKVIKKLIVIRNSALIIFQISNQYISQNSYISILIQRVNEVALIKNLVTSISGSLE